MDAAALRLRSETLRRLREFFHRRGFLEVETPLLAAEVIPESHIEPVAAGTAAWLQASPELHMKRLLAEGAGAIYQITRSFRGGERGAEHNPEFTIVEWYRPGDDFQMGMSLLADLCQEVGGAPRAQLASYQDVLLEHAGLDPFKATLEELQAAAGIDPVDDRDLLLDAICARVHPKLGHDRPLIVYHYPASQSALARTATDESGNAVAERFELFWKGLELANGYHELTDAAELRTRLERVGELRRAAGKPPLPMPESLLAAMERGLPPCAGVALGLDRLLMAMSGAADIGDMLALGGWPTHSDDAGSEDGSNE